MRSGCPSAIQTCKNPNSFREIPVDALSVASSANRCEALPLKPSPRVAAMNSSSVILKAPRRLKQLRQAFSTVPKTDQMVTARLVIISAKGASTSAIEMKPDWSKSKAPKICLAPFPTPKVWQALRNSKNDSLPSWFTSMDFQAPAMLPYFWIKSLWKSKRIFSHWSRLGWGYFPAPEAQPPAPQEPCGSCLTFRGPPIAQRDQKLAELTRTKTAPALGVPVCYACDILCWLLCTSAIPSGFCWYVALGLVIIQSCWPEIERLGPGVCESVIFGHSPHRILNEEQCCCYVFCTLSCIDLWTWKASILGCILGTSRNISQKNATHSTEEHAWRC